MNITRIIGLILGLLTYSVLIFFVICLSDLYLQYKHKCQELEKELRDLKEQSND